MYPNEHELGWVPGLPSVVRFIDIPFQRRRLVTVAGWDVGACAPRSGSKSEGGLKDVLIGVLHTALLGVIS